MPTAYSYVRFSTPEQRKGDSLRRQTEKAEEYAKRKGLTMDRRLAMQDLGVSAFRGANVKKGALGAFLKAAEDGIVKRGSYLLVESLDRVSRRDPYAALRVFQDIIDAGVVLVTLADMQEYSRASIRQDPTKLLMSLLVMIRANEESERKSERLREAWLKKRKGMTTKPLTAKAPAWLTLDKRRARFTLLPDRAKIVRRIFKLTLDGVGQHSIAETFNRERVPCFGDAKHWHRSYIAKILSNPAVMGTFIPHHVVFDDDDKKLRKPLEPVLNYFPPAVDEQTYKAVQQQRQGSRAPTTRKALGNKVASLLAGLARCPACGGTMTRVAKGKRSSPYFVCAKAKVGAGCKYRAVRQDAVESSLLGNASYLIGTAPSGNSKIDRDIAKNEAALDAHRDEAQRLVKLLMKRRSPTAEAQLTEVERDIAKLEAAQSELFKRSEVETGPSLSVRLDQLLNALEAPKLDVSKANALMRQCLKSVVLDYKQGMLEFEWKHGGASEVAFALSE